MEKPINFKDFPNRFEYLSLIVELVYNKYNTEKFQKVKKFICPIQDALFKTPENTLLKIEIEFFEFLEKHILLMDQFSEKRKELYIRRMYETEYPR